MMNPIAGASRGPAESLGGLPAAISAPAEAAAAFITLMGGDIPSVATSAAGPVRFQDGAGSADAGEGESSGTDAAGEGESSGTDAAQDMLPIPVPVPVPFPGPYAGLAAEADGAVVRVQDNGAEGQPLSGQPSLQYAAGPRGGAANSAVKPAVGEDDGVSGASLRDLAAPPDSARGDVTRRYRALAGSLPITPVDTKEDGAPSQPGSVPSRGHVPAPSSVSGEDARPAAGEAAAQVTGNAGNPVSDRSSGSSRESVARAARATLMRPALEGEGGHARALEQVGLADLARVASATGTGHGRLLADVLLRSADLPVGSTPAVAGTSPLEARVREAIRAMAPTEPEAARESDSSIMREVADILESGAVRTRTRTRPGRASEGTPLIPARNEARPPATGQAAAGPSAAATSTGQADLARLRPDDARDRPVPSSTSASAPRFELPMITMDAPRAELSARAQPLSLSATVVTSMAERIAEVARTVDLAAAGRGDQFRMDLPEFGPGASLQVSMRGREVSARIVLPGQDDARAMQARSSELRGALIERGFEPGAIRFDALRDVPDTVRLAEIVRSDTVRGLATDSSSVTGEARNGAGSREEHAERDRGGRNAHEDQQERQAREDRLHNLRRNRS
jgi:hypothetical protein